MKNSVVSMLSILFVALSVVSCQVEDGLPDKLRKAIFKINAEEKILEEDIYLIIPGAGCDKCIKEAKNFFFKDIEKSNSRVKFIFTEIGSMKFFKLEMGDKITGNSRILLDHNMEIFRAGVKSIYPLIYIPGEGGVIEVTPERYEALLKLSTLQKRKK